MWKYGVLLATGALYIAVNNCSSQPLLIPLPPGNSEAILNDLQSFPLAFASFPHRAGKESSPEHSLKI